MAVIHGVGVFVNNDLTLLNTTHVYYTGIMWLCKPFRGFGMAYFDV